MQEWVATQRWHTWWLRSPFQKREGSELRIADLSAKPEHKNFSDEVRQGTDLVRQQTVSSAKCLRCMTSMAPTSKTARPTWNHVWYNAPRVGSAKRRGEGSCVRHHEP